MKPRIAMLLMVLAVLAGVGCDVTLDGGDARPYPPRGPGGGPYPPPPPPAADGWVTGTVVFHMPGRKRLDEDAVLDVELFEVRRRGGLGPRLGDVTIRRIGRSPVPFKLRYRPRDVDPRHDYVLIAQIRLPGRTLFENAGSYAVITKGRPAYADIRMDYVGEPHHGGPGGGPPHHDGAAVPPGPLTGTIRWRARRALPDGAVLQVELWDAARIAKPGGRLARHEIRRLDKPPVAFKLAYDRGKLDPDRDYVVLARIVLGDRAIFRTADTHRVITKGRPRKVEVELSFVGR